MSKVYDHTKVPVPQLILDHCERDPRGLYVPFVVLKTEDGKYHFKINDTEKSIQCMVHQLCSICGQKLDLKNDTWLLGGVASAFDPQGGYIDLPIHKECGHYALKVCPYMAIRNYHATFDLEKLQEKLPGIKLENPTVDQDRLPLFAFIRPAGYQVELKQGQHYIVRPKHPYHEVEFWRDGEPVDNLQDIEEYLLGTKWEKYLFEIGNFYNRQSQYIDYEDV